MSIQLKTVAGEFSPFLSFITVERSEEAGSLQVALAATSVGRLPSRGRGAP